MSARYIKSIYERAQLHECLKTTIVQLQGSFNTLSKFEKFIYNHLYSLQTT